MNANEMLIEKFYTAFKNKDYKSMQACYADNATFSDAIFKDLNAAQTKAMWQMLLTKSKDIRVVFSAVTADKYTGTVHWDAYYTFTSTDKKVVNKVDAKFEFENGKIVKHTDNFNFYAWAKQALGLSGLLLGWTSFMKNKIQTTAQNNLAKFMAKSD